MEEEKNYWDKVPRRFHLMLQSQFPCIEDVEDIKQETLFAIWKARNRFDSSKMPLSHWAYRQARWQTAKYYNKYIKIKYYELYCDYKCTVSYVNKPLDKLIIDETLRRFPPEYQLIAVEVLSGKCLVDIAKEYNLTIDTVRCRFERMVQFIKDYPDSNVVYNKTRRNLK